MLKETRRILCILQLPPPFHGVSIMNNAVIKSEKLRNNFNFDVINLHFSQSIKGLEVFSFSKVFKAIHYGFTIIKRIISQKPDLVYFSLAIKSFAFYRDAFYVFLIKLLNINIIFHLHGKGINKIIQKNFLKKSLYKRVFKNTHVICLSKNLAEDISSVYKSVPFIVPNGIEVMPKNNQDINNLKQEIPRILYFSNFKRDKGILILLDALEILKNKQYNFYVRIIGEPFDLSTELLNSVILNKNLKEFVHVAGPLYGNDKYLEFQQADIFVFPTYNDAFPLVILEAMQNSLPVISTFEGGIPEIIVDQETGVLVEIQNSKMLADKIAILLKDKDLRLKMGKKGYDRYKSNFTIDHFENQMNSIFHKILEIH